MAIGIFDTGLLLAGAGAVAFLTYLVIQQLVLSADRKAMSGGMHSFNRQPGAEGNFDAATRPGTDTFKIRTTFARLGITVKPGAEKTTVYLAHGVIAAVAFLPITLLGINILLALAGAVGIAYAVVQSLIASQWEKERVSIEQEVPTLMYNISGIVQVKPDAISALESARAALDPNRPLAQWVEYLARRIQSEGQAAFEFLTPEAYAISSALGVMVFEVQRMMEVGGSGYSQAFRMAAENLSEILVVRGQAAAKAGGSSNLALLIIGAAIFMIGYILMTPTGEMYLANAMFKIGLVAAVGWGVYGWVFIKGMVREATE